MTLQSKLSKIASFDPNAPGLDENNIYGLPFTPEEADIVIIPVPWEVTVSYGNGTIEGPEVILEASKQVDLYHPHAPEIWKAGISLAPFPEALAHLSADMKLSAKEWIDSLSTGQPLSPRTKSIADINAACKRMVDYVEREAGKWIDEGKIVGLIGGDHSIPLGFIQALSKRHSSFGILQLDAHADLRIDFEGFAYSHASIMYNVLKTEEVSHLVQVGIRDYCLEELQVMQSEKNRVITFFDRDLQNERIEGITWAQQVEKIITCLPEKVYISFDIDGLDPALCPNTGTPVPGGMSFAQAEYLIRKVSESGKEIIGFDLNEVAPGDDEWDANVGARMLFQLCVYAWRNKN